MVKYFNYIIILSVSFVLLACKKKTTISVKVINQKLDGYVTGAKVVLLEIKHHKLSGKLLIKKAPLDALITQVEVEKRKWR